MTETVDLVLRLPGADGALREAWRVTLPPAAVVANRDAVIAEFRAMSGARGMTMEAREIRERCWAPLTAKLAGLMTTYADGADTATAHFAALALSYLALLACRDLAAGDTVTVTLAAGGELSVAREPRRLLARRRVVIGNQHEAMADMALALTQVT